VTPPTVLLAAIEDFLREEFSAQQGPYAAYQARVAANLLALLRREAELGSALAALDTSFAKAQGLDPLDMPAALALALRDGRVSDSPVIRDYLRRRSLLCLGIDNPRYSGLQQAREEWPALTTECDT
jgi:hypothetical protein